MAEIDKSLPNTATEVEIPEKEPADFLTTVEPSNDGTGIVNFSMSATNASSYKIEIFEQDGVTLIHDETTTNNFYTNIFAYELLVPVTFN